MLFEGMKIVFKNLVSHLTVLKRDLRIKLDFEYEDLFNVVDLNWEVVGLQFHISEPLHVGSFVPGWQL